MMDSPPAPDPVQAAFDSGRGCGYAAGDNDAQWSPSLTHDTVAAQRDEVRYVRENSGRQTRAYVLGYARAYRAAVGVGGKERA